MNWDSRAGSWSMVSMPFRQFKSAILHSSEQYRGIGPWSMTVRDRVVGAGCCCVGAGGAAAVTLRLEVERLTAPFGFTRPVPCASPPFARTLPDFVRVVFAGAASAG